METYVYYSIVVFSSFIFLLYIYLLFEKIKELFNKKKRVIYTKNIFPYIDNLVSISESQEIDQSIITKLSGMAKNKIQRNIISDRFLYYMELFTGDIRFKTANLCDRIGLIDIEIKNMQSRDYFKVALSCKRLGEFRSKKALPSIISILSSNNDDIKYHALKALAKIGDVDSFVTAMDIVKRKFVLSERSLTEIVDSFEGDKLNLYRRMIVSDSPYLSTIFINSAGNYMDSTLSSDISNFLDDSNKDRKIAAIKAIGKIGDSRYLDKITAALKDDNWEVRAVAARSLGRLNDYKAIIPLSESLSDTEWWVRYNSAWSIIQVPGGIDTAENIIRGTDKFARDILISAIQNSGVLDNLQIYDNSADLKKRNLLMAIKQYSENNEIVR